MKIYEDLRVVKSRLTVVQSAIQDYRDNITRFLLIARDPQPLAPPDKTSLVFALPNAPGALFKALSVFALRDIDLTKLESRPMRGRPRAGKPRTNACSRRRSRPRTRSAGRPSS